MASVRRSTYNVVLHVVVVDGKTLCQLLDSDKYFWIS